MSRSGYSEDFDCEGTGGLWRGAVERAIRGKRGQAFLREMAAALDAMPVKELVAGVLVEDGAACAIGAVALSRGLDVSGLDETKPDDVASTFGIAPALAKEIAYENDECSPWRPRDQPAESRAQRWTRMRAWVASQLRDEREEQKR